MGANEVFTEEEFVSIENRKALASKYPQVSVAFNCTGGKSATELARFLSFVFLSLIIFYESL